MIFRGAASTAIVVVMAAALVVAQFIPVKRTNPAGEGMLLTPPDIKLTLRRACYDCHSNQTQWPWYSHIAPVSWLIVRDVDLGRREINFSEWGSYYPATRRRKLEWMGRALREEKMPPWFYRLMHPGANVTEADRAELERWIKDTLTESALQTPVK